MESYLFWRNLRKLALVFGFWLSLSCLFAQTTDKRWTLIWSDEFDMGSKPDTAKWNYEKGFCRNNELQWYQKDNASISKGRLVIEGRKENRPNPLYDPNSNDWRKSRKMVEYSASSITTRGKFEFQYGRIEVRAKIPTMSGAWPAIWTLGSHMSWPECGEVDLMEYYRIDEKPNILANVAWGGAHNFKPIWDSSHHPFSAFQNKQKGWEEYYHIWRMDWDSTSIKLYLDDELLNETLLKDAKNLTNGKNPFMQPHYILLNLAMGSKGGPIDNAALPMKYEIDYVRVYQQTDKLQTMVYPRKLWLDNNGHHINAHGGGILFHDNKYYWYGEHKNYFDNSAQVGVTCYSSTDLINWSYEGTPLKVSEDPESMITKGCVIERPKVIYNSKTKKFVMWFHLELKGKGYKAALSGVAESDSPVGPFRFIEATRSNAGILPLNVAQKDFDAIPSDFQRYKAWSPEWKVEMPKGLLLKRDMIQGQMERDMTLFVDDDGKAYHIFASEDNQTLHIAQLTDDYLRHNGNYVRVAQGGANEAPTIFKRNGTYWMITSGCTGWAPNEARMFSATNILGPWTQYPNPCIGKDAKITFGAQGTYIQPVLGKKDAFIFMADIWTPDFPYEGRYLWLPIQFKNGVPVLEEKEMWSLDLFEKASL